MKSVKVSVIVASYNNRKFIRKCVESILNQTFKNFELIVIDDCSIDNSYNILKRFKDRRLKIIKNKKNSGISISRNKGIKVAKGEYVFFTDGDCTVTKNWIKEGLRVFKDKKCLGVEGKTYYVSKNFVPTASDRVVENLNGGKFMTCNMAYSKKVLKKVSGFDIKLKRIEDRDLAFKIKKIGDISFSKYMVVFHQKNKWSFKKRIKIINEDVQSRILLFKKNKDKSIIYFRVYSPLNLLVILFPPLVLGAVFLNRYKTFSDVKYLLGTYPILVYERILLWKNCLKEMVFLV